MSRPVATRPRSGPHRFLDFVARHSACGRGQDECALDVRRLAAIFKSDPVILHAFIDLMPEWVYSPDIDLGSTTA